MTNNTRLLPFFIAAMISFSSCPLWAQEAQPSKAVVITAAGSGVNLGITTLLAKAFMEKNPTVEIKVPGSIGTKGAITAIKDDAITFGLISRELKKEEQAPEYTALAYGLTPIVIGVHRAVPDDTITSEELVAIYKGTKTKWSNGSEIIVHSREAYDSGFSIVEKSVLGFKEACDESRAAQRWITHFTDQEANHATAVTKNAIGVTDLGMIATEHLDIKSLKFNGIAPTVETAQNGQYPLTRTLYLLYRDKTLPAQARAFIDFIRSNEGTEILKASGYVPLAANKP